LGDADFVHDDIWRVDPGRVRERPDVIWMSPPCQDLSVAGRHAGLDGSRSGAFWGAIRFIEGLSAAGHKPETIVLENVKNFLSLNGGKDFSAAIGAFEGLGYFFVAVHFVDAAHFLPQNRERVLIVASTTSDHVLPPMPKGKLTLEDILDPSPPRSREPLALGSNTLKEIVSGFVGYACANHRRRPSGSHWEARFDGLAQCLRTGGGGGSIQRILKVERGGRVLHRKITPREGARLMGLPDSYKLPATTTHAWNLIGDGVVAPVVSHVLKGLTLRKADAA
jgi:DNA (cytosine-5)-methyltransferase 1